MDKKTVLTYIRKLADSYQRRAADPASGNGPGMDARDVRRIGNLISLGRWKTAYSEWESLDSIVRDNFPNAVIFFMAQMAGKRPRMSVEDLMLWERSAQHAFTIAREIERYIQSLGLQLHVKVPGKPFEIIPFTTKNIVFIPKESNDQESLPIQIGIRPLTRSSGSGKRVLREKGRS